MALKTWRFKKSSLQASSIQTEKVLKSEERKVTRSKMDFLGPRSFMSHHAKRFEYSAIGAAYQKVGDKNIQTVRRNHRKTVALVLNTISLHVDHKIEAKDGCSFWLRARRVPAGKEGFKRKTPSFNF